MLQLPINYLQAKPSSFIPLLFLSCLIPLSSLADDKLSGIHLGVSSCASTVCHGGTNKKGGNVNQNEYRTWFRHDAHSKAYKTLTSEESKIIAKHLDISSPETAKECLQCHSTYVPKENQGPKFRITDGVGCESCHGPSEHYIKSHTARGRTHQENVNDGLIDLSSLTIRTELCLSCHQGNDSQYVNHRLIGAGHPRLSFELDTYSILQPKHWDIDEDYIKRKGEYRSSKAWLIGQAIRAKEMLELLSSKERAKFGIMPELSNYYCSNCHHSLKEEQWKSRSYNGRPGELHLNISSLIMTSLALEVIDKKLSKEFTSLSKELPLAHVKGEDREILSRLTMLINSQIIPLATEENLTKEKISALMKRILTFSVDTTHLPYEVAEQCLMAITSLSSELTNGKPFYPEKISEIYRSLRHENDFKPEEFTKAAKALKDVFSEDDIKN